MGVGWRDLLGEDYAERILILGTWDARLAIKGEDCVYTVHIIIQHIAY